MKIEMYQFEVMDAIAYYAKEKLGLNMNPHSADSRISLDVNEWKPQYEKHSNGKYVRDEKGHAILDESEEHWVNHKLEFGDMDTMSIYFWTPEDDDQEVAA
jgi:hypothetical protein